jgi:hypothetical protein
MMRPDPIRSLAMTDVLDVAHDERLNAGPTHDEIARPGLQRSALGKAADLAAAYVPLPGGARGE